MSLFKDKAVTQIAKTASQPAAAVRRLLGSLKVQCKDAVGAPFDIGLRIAPEILETPEGVEHSAAAVAAYSAACPQVIAWVARGDFHLERVPETLHRSVLLHACRTAGRLRAGVLRVGSTGR